CSRTTSNPFAYW
nr:immunoglobulin heavy chain junction region [Mus musculus]